MRAKYLSANDYMYAIGMYITWQALYFVKTEVLDTYKLDKDPSYITSLRWLSKDTKNAMAKLTKQVMRRIGVLKPDENFDSNSYKTKFIFISTQFVYTLLTFAPLCLLFMSETANLLFIILIFTASVFYGAGYYVHMGVMTKKQSEANIVSNSNINTATSPENKRHAEDEDKDEKIE